MDHSLSGKTVAVLVANGFEELDMTEPQRALLAAGATPKVVSPEQGLVNGWHGKSWGHYFPVDISLSSALAADFDALLVPGGQRGLDKLLNSPHTMRFVRGFMDAGKPVAALNHGALVLVAAERIAGRTVAAPADVVAKLQEAGAAIAEDPVVTDGNLLTSSDEAGMDEIKTTIARLFTEITSTLANAA